MSGVISVANVKVIEGIGLSTSGGISSGGANKFRVDPGPSLNTYRHHRRAAGHRRVLLLQALLDAIAVATERDRKEGR